MANEITVSVDLNLNVGTGSGAQDSSGSRNLKVDQTNPRYFGEVKDIGTSPENLSFGDVADPGFGYFKNHGTTVAEIGRDISGFQEFLELGVGEAQLIKLASGIKSSVQAQFLTSSGKLEYMFYDR